MNDKRKLEHIWRLYALVSVLYVILGVLAFKIMNVSSLQVTSGFWSSNPLISQTNTVFAPASHVLYSIQYRYVLMAILLISIITPILYIYMINNGYKKIDLHKFRFYDWLITGGMMLLLIASLNGIQDLMTRILLVTFSVFFYVFILFAINNYKDKKEIDKKAFLIGTIFGLIPWIVIFYYVISTLAFGNVRSAWYVYALILIGVINTALIIYGYFWHNSRNGKKQLISDETYPIIANALIKISFAAILIIGLKR
jgi:hypothetical protein